MDNPRHRGPISLHNTVTPIHHALVPLPDEVDLATQVDTKPDHGPHSSIHTLRVTPTCENCDPFSLLGTSFNQFPLDSQGQYWQGVGGPFVGGSRMVTHWCATVKLSCRSESSKFKL